jgi:thioredoxin-related protein
MEKLNKQINLVINVTIVVVLLCIGVVFIKNYRHSDRSATQPRDYHLPVGSKISLPGVDWERNGQTLLLVLDTGCPYCTASASFYQEIVRENAQKRRVQLIGVLPQDVPSSKKYLNDLSIPIDEVKQSKLEALGVKGTPTLILIDSEAKVMNSWPGKLSPEEERNVLEALR